MEPNTKRPKKRAKKAVGEGQPAAPLAKIVQPDNYPSWRDEEELIDYEPEEPESFSPVEVDNSVEEDDYPAQGDGTEDNIPVTDDFPAYPAEGSDMAGRKRCQKVLNEEGEHSRKTSRSIGIGSPLQEGDNATTNDDQMDLAALSTGVRGSGRMSAALPVGGGSSDVRSNPAVLPMGGSSDARRNSAALPMGGG
jgi:hypothetical protein